MVSMVPVRLQANGAENVTARDGDGIPEVLLAEVAAVLIRRHGANSNAVSCCAEIILWKEPVPRVSKVAK